MNNQLCPKCQTGLESYQLDPKSEACPYIASHNGNSCAFFKPLKYESESDTDEGV